MLIFIQRDNNREKKAERFLKIRRTQTDTREFMPLKRPLIAQVGVAQPIRKLFDYKLPYSGEDTSSPQPGVRVEVPFGRRKVIGIIINIRKRSDLDKTKLKTILSILDNRPLIPCALLRLLEWSASYYQHPLGDAAMRGLPNLLRKGAPLPETRKKYWHLSTADTELVLSTVKSSPKQKALITFLMGLKFVSDEELSKEFSRSIIKQVYDNGYISQTFIDSPKTKNNRILNDKKLTLNPEQQRVFNHISLEKYHCWLLNGITGSGKTEIYLQLIEKVLKQGKQTLILVPEISLTPQTEQRFHQRFSVPLVSLHSGMTDKQRLFAWTMAKNGDASIILGTRSAIFTPIPRLALIIIDEEQDSSYKQQEGFRYSARDIAVMRAKHENVPIILGSATPSLESLHNCHSGRYTELNLTERAGHAKTEKWKLIDMRYESVTTVIADDTLLAIKNALTREEQVLVFLNRRGFAPALLCHCCGWVAECKNCDSRMTLHRSHNKLICHHCDFRYPPPSVCPRCKSMELIAYGAGTERSELLLQKAFPTTPIIRVDRDTSRKRDFMNSVYHDVKKGNPCILVGTQMLAKGPHFGGITLAVILDADTGLLSPDFRALERMGQLITQVAGRSGRSEKAGEVLIQTHQPFHPSLNLLLHSGYREFAQSILVHREQQKLPPYYHLALIRAESTHASAAEDFLKTIKIKAQELCSPTLKKMIYTKPMPALLERKSNRYRYVFRIETGDRHQLQKVLSQLAFEMEKLPKQSGVRWTIDVDALDL